MHVCTASLGQPPRFVFWSLSRVNLLWLHLQEQAVMLHGRQVVAHARPIDVHTSAERGQDPFRDQRTALHHQRLQQWTALGEGAAGERGVELVNKEVAWIEVVQDVPRLLLLLWWRPVDVEAPLSERRQRAFRDPRAAAYEQGPDARTLQSQGAEKYPDADADWPGLPQKHHTDTQTQHERTTTARGK